jgi:uncharacterized protein with beta-barrel porin domain
MTGGQIGTATASVNQEGISASSGTGSINITSTSIFATNGGIDTQVAGGAGNTSITLNGNVITNLGAGVNAVSSGTGTMFIGGTGNITSTLGDGIVAKQTAAATSGNLTINTSGNIIAQSGASNGIIAQITNAANNADISVTHSGTNTSSLIATTLGGGNVTVNTSKDIGGLFAINVGTTSGAATVNVSGGTLTPAFTGILASAATSGNVVVNMTGGQIGTATASVNQEGISASSGTGSINITSTSIFATNGGIEASGAGPISVQNNGAVTSLAGIGVDLIGGTTKSVTNVGSITAPVGMSMTTGLANVFNSGTITGTGGTAIQFAGVGNTLTLAPTSAIVGNVLGTGLDTFQLGGIGVGSFDASQIGPAAQYRGFASYNKVDASIWTLTGTNGLALPWTLQQGALDVEGTLANSTFTVNGGLLTGKGIVGATQINNGGTFAPGTPGSPGTSMTISGNLAFQSGAIYLVQINPSTASLANVSGTATLAGTLSASFAPGNYTTKQYDILHSAGLGGTTFNALTTNLLAGFLSKLSYTSTDVFLNLTAALGQQNPGAPLPSNQQGVANSINNFFNNGGTLPPGFSTLFGLTGNNLMSALSQVSGETATGTQQTTFDAMIQFMGVMTDPFIGGRGDGLAAGAGATPFAEEFDAANAYAAKDPARSRSEREAYAAVYHKAPLMAPFVPSWSVWAAGFGGSQTTSGNATVGSNDTTSRLGAVAVGADYRFSPNTIAGVALAGGGTNFSVANGGSGRSDLFQAGAFVRHTIGPAYFTGALAYGWQDITTDRTVTIAGIDRLRARFNANAFSGRIEDGYRFATPWMGVTSYAAAQFTTFELPAYAESVVSGANTFALAYGARSVTATRSEIGLRTDKSWAMPDSILTLRGRFAWAHDYNTDRSIGATFQTLPGASFVVNGAAQSADKALTTASAELKWRSGVSLAATFEGEFSSNSSSYAGKGVARYQW